MLCKLRKRNESKVRVFVKSRSERPLRSGVFICQLILLCFLVAALQPHQKLAAEDLWKALDLSTGRSLRPARRMSA